MMRFTVFIRSAIAALSFALSIQGQARLIAHYDFSDGDLLDNEVRADQYRLEQHHNTDGLMSQVLLNRAEAIAVFPGGMDSMVWLECKGPGNLPEFTISFWYRTDQIDQRMTFLGLISSGKLGAPGSWQLHSDTRLQGSLRFRSGNSLILQNASTAVEISGQWIHVALQKDRSGAMSCTVTPEGGSVGAPGFRKERVHSMLNDIVLGTDCDRRTGYRMDMANVRIYDSAEVSIKSLFAAGPGTRNSTRAKSGHIQDSLTNLQEDRAMLTALLAHLPVLEDPLQLDAYGCHSSFLPVSGERPEKPRWTIHLTQTSDLRAREIYLIPAADRRAPLMPGYGFPKRFCIVGTLENGVSTILADWKDRDFPAPGRLPVRFLIPWGKYHELRVEVFRGCIEAEKEFFALDEIFVRSESNLIAFDEPRISGSFEAPPFWSQDYLTDGKTSLGLPILPGPQGDVADCVTALSDGPVVLEMDLGENKKVSDIIFYPAHPPEGLVIPGYGFPGTVQVESFIQRKNTGTPKLLSDRFVREKANNPGNNIVRLFSQPRPIRWLRFTFSDFPEYEGTRVFGLGEIEATFDRESASAGCLVQSESLEPGVDLSLLTDGYSGGRKVIPVLQWLDALSLRRDLNVWLKTNTKSQHALITRREKFHRRLLTCAASALFLFLAGMTLAGALLRRRQSTRFRQRVTQDLHDDIGSKIGAISLAATFLQKTVPTPQANECGADIKEIADELKQSLRDVLWFTSSSTDQLRELVCKLVEIAEQTIPEEMLSLRHTALREVPDTAIRVETKRDVMMFFREVLHNAAKHADASKINIGIHWNRPYLYVCIRDNGKGFDIDRAQNDRSQFGLAGLRRRAKRMRADWSIHTAPGQGTSVELRVKTGRL